MIGQTVSHYAVLERLGGGGMGVVYKARDTRLDRIVALKFLPPELTRDPEAKQRFVHEAKTASSLQHNNICTIHDIDETPDGQLFIVMDYYDGETIKKKIERGPLKLEEALQLALQTAQGLSKAHEQQMIHRDIKPANVMVTEDGVAKVVDFGLARLAGMSRLTKAGDTVGTVAYMSPEQLRGEEADGRADLWSLGVMLYEMLTGRLPFRGEHESALVYSILNTDADPLTAVRSGLPIELDHVLGKALAKRPDERYQHADEFSADLRHLLRESERQTAVPASGPGPRKKRRGLVISGLLLVALVAGLLIFRPFVMEEMLVSEPRPIAVISFMNQTGDTSFDYLQEAIPNLLITNLEQSRYLRVATWERMRDLLKQMGKNNVTVIDRDLGFELCEKDGIDVIVLGSYVKAGNVFATDVKVLDVRTKQMLKSASARGEGVESILTSQIDRLSHEISRGAGLSERVTQAASVAIAGQTTSSMEAYNYYLRGMDEYQKFYFADAKKFFQKAVSIDTSFAAAHARLGLTEYQLGNTSEAQLSLMQARRLEHRAPIKTRLKVNGLYAWYLEHDGPKATAIVQDLVRLYPEDKEGYFYLGLIGQEMGKYESALQNFSKAVELDPTYADALNSLSYVYAEQGNFELALECLKKYAALQPGHANPFDSMGEIYFRMGRMDDAIAKYMEALEVRPDFFPSRAALMYIYALRGDHERSEEVLRGIEKDLRSRGWSAEVLCLRAIKSYFAGELSRTLSQLRQAEAIADTAGNIALRAACTWMEGWIRFERGDYEGARDRFRQSFEGRMLGDTSFTSAAAAQFYYALGRVDLLTGRIDSAKARLRDLHALAEPTRRLARATVALRREMLAALVEVAQDSAVTAIGRLRRLAPWPIPTFNTIHYIYYNIPADRDLLARAYVQHGDLLRAIAECDHLCTFDPSGPDRQLVHPRYRYLLATLYERNGDKVKAAEEYRRCIDFWKGADPDLPEYVAAKKHLAVLTRGSAR